MKSHPWGSNPHFTRAEKDRFQHRRIAIFDAGVAAAQAGLHRQRRPGGIAFFEGQSLGSMETITFYNGILSVDPECKHPYGDAFADPHRPEEP